ncbi:hypothetical protein [Lysobacter olei]
MKLKSLLGCMSLTLAAACALPLHAEEAPSSVGIHLVSQGGQWEVRYALPRPARTLRFVRVDQKGNRAKTWTPVDPELTIALEGGEEVIRRTDGAAFDHVAFRMSPRYMTLEKDYAPFAPFGDGGLLIHSGRFHACVDRCVGGESFRLSLQPPTGAHGIVHGQVVPTIRIEDSGDGTNLYVGRALPVATPDVVAVIDAAFPADTRGRLESLLPRLMAFYGHEFGVLSSRPMLFASRDEAHPDGGYGFQGGTLPGQVFMHLYGRHEAFKTAAFASRLDWFFAHEAAHLYQRFAPLADAGDSWIHEGGADALAAVALQALGVVERGAVEARLQSSLGTCAAGIGQHALTQAHVDGSFEASYACGFVMQMAVDAAAMRASQGACGLACVWREFQAKVAAGAAWNTTTFIDVAAQRVDSRTVRFLRDVAYEVPAQPDALLRDGLVKAGWTLPAPASGTQ